MKGTDHHLTMIDWICYICLFATLICIKWQLVNCSTMGPSASIFIIEPVATFVAPLLTFVMLVHSRTMETRLWRNQL